MICTTVASADDMEQEEGSGNVSKGKRVGGCHHPALLQSGKEGLNVRMIPVEVSSFSTVCVCTRVPRGALEYAVV